MTELENVLHWYDFLCPFCYVAQSRNAILVDHGLDLIELPFQAHPDIPENGATAPARVHAMYSTIELEAREAGLKLHWPPRLPNTRRALAAAEWVRVHEPQRFTQFHRSVFAAHFVLGEDLGDEAVIYRHAGDSGINVMSLRAALADGSAMAAVGQSEAMARQHGVRGTPAWLIAGRLISGLLPVQDFERLAKMAARV